jgi:ribosomal protein S12 methylthiotransferase accessory factor
MNSRYERACTTSQAMHIAEKALQALNLRASDEAHGVDLQTYRCQLIDDENQAIFYGFGKGLGLQSKVSAYYEALEHYAVHRFAQEAAANQDNYKTLHPYEHALPCVALSDIQTNEALSYPVFMLDPRYAKCKAEIDKMDYLPYAYRASDSGIASGSNMIEASIHALNELVERDAHSLFLIEAFIKNNNQRIRLIDKATLPISQQDIVKKIEKQYHDDLMLFDITTEVGITVIYASMTKQPVLIQPSGCGASLRAEYALERALLEALQPVHIYNEKLADNQRQIMGQLSDFPLLLKAAVADVMALEYQKIDFNSLTDHAGNLSLSDQLKTIIQKIETTGCKVFKIPIINLVGGFTCVKFLIPDFEQFHLVQTGKRILPSERGMQLLNRKGNVCWNYAHEKKYRSLKSPPRSFYGCCSAQDCACGCTRDTYIANSDDTTYSWPGTKN